MSKRIAYIVCILIVFVKVTPANGMLLERISGDTNSIEASVKAEVEFSPKVNSKPAFASIDVQLNISSIESELTGNETVFVYARAWQGAKVPLAIKRFTVNELPSQISLDSSNAMAPAMDITSAKKLELIARVSKSGQASPQTGDWFATAGPISIETQKKPVVLNVTKQYP